jgi:hypothetical protein
MKKLSLFFAAIFMMGSISLMAQKPFAGTIKTKIDVAGTTDGNITSQFPIEQKTTVLGNKTKTVMEQGIGIIMIEDNDQGTRTTILDFAPMGMGCYYRTDTVKAPTMLKYDYVTDKNDTKEIAGYKSYKVTCTITNLEDDETTVVILYVSDDFLPGYKSSQTPGLVGYPMSTIQHVDNEEGGYDMISEVIEITPNKKIKSVDFLLPEKAVPLADAPANIKQMLGLGGGE